jgi:hypothetical protein
MYAKLRVKLKSLTAEARIIRFEERRTKRTWRRLAERQAHKNPQAIPALHDTFDSLHRHRTCDVRVETRAALLAYAMLRKRPYELVEKPGARKPPLAKVADLVSRFGGVELGRETALAQVRDWLGLAEAAPAA